MQPNDLRLPPLVRTCHCCGLQQRLPPIIANDRVRCRRCGARISHPDKLSRSRSRTGAIAVAALIFYPLAIGLPILEIEQFGHVQTSSLLDGVVQLLSSGQWFVGTVVLLCSIVFPVGKLLSLILLCWGGGRLCPRKQAWIYRAVEWTGRWGMLDVLLVALLVAVLKLGDMLTVNPGQGALCFTICVVLSLIASACFDPHCLWSNESPEGTSRGEHR